MSVKLIEVKKIKDIRGRGRIMGYRASCRDIESDVMETGMQAEEQCADRIKDVCTYETGMTRTIAYKKQVYTITVYRVLGEWSYVISTFDIDKREAHVMTQQTGSKERTQAYLSASYHVAQSAYDWTGESRVFASDVLANEKAWKEFCSWADWQDRARIIQAKGYMSNEVHRLACETRTIEEARNVPEFQLTR